MTDNVWVCMINGGTVTPNACLSQWPDFVALSL